MTRWRLFPPVPLWLLGELLHAPTRTATANASPVATSGRATSRRRNTIRCSHSAPPEMRLRGRSKSGSDCRNGERRRTPKKAETSPGQGAQVRRAEHLPGRRPDREFGRRVRLALRALGRPSWRAEATGPLWLLHPPSSGDEAEALATGW